MFMNWKSKTVKTFQEWTPISKSPIQGFYGIYNTHMTSYTCSQTSYSSCLAFVSNYRFLSYAFQVIHCVR